VNGWTLVGLYIVVGFRSVFCVGVGDCELRVDLAGEKLPVADALPAGVVGDSLSVTVANRASVRSGIASHPNPVYIPVVYQRQYGYPKEVL
jgi:hypothetical protein